MLRFRKRERNFRDFFSENEMGRLLKVYKDRFHFIKDNWLSLSVTALAWHPQSSGSISQYENNKQ